MKNNLAIDGATGMVGRNLNTREENLPVSITIYLPQHVLQESRLNLWVKTTQWRN